MASDKTDTPTPHDGPATAKTAVVVTVHGLDERILVDGTHDALEPKVDPKAQPTTEPQPVEYDDALYTAVGRHFVQNFRTLVDTSEPDPNAEKAIADDMAARQADADKSEKAAVKA